MNLLLSSTCIRLNELFGLNLEAIHTCTYIGAIFSPFLNAVKCNLTELTTKIASVPVKSAVFTYAHVLGFHVLLD